MRWLEEAFDIQGAQNAKHKYRRRRVQEMLDLVCSALLFKASTIRNIVFTDADSLMPVCYMMGLS